MWKILKSFVAKLFPNWMRIVSEEQSGNILYGEDYSPACTEHLPYGQVIELTTFVQDASPKLKFKNGQEKELVSWLRYIVYPFYYSQCQHGFLICQALQCCIILCWCLRMLLLSYPCFHWHFFYIKTTLQSFFSFLGLYIIIISIFSICFSSNIMSSYVTNLDRRTWVAEQYLIMECVHYFMWKLAIVSSLS